MTEAKIRLGILISGRGSNMKAIVDACESGEVLAEVARVISNKRDAAGIDWARGRGLECRVLPHGDFESREAHDRAVVAELKAAEVQWVCLAGYMRLLSPIFVEAFRQRILNIHPSLLPAFPGLHAQQQAWDYGVRWTGCTVHMVDAELDHGPIVEQQVVPVDPHGSAMGLEQTILDQEHRLYVRALRRLLSEGWSLQGRRVVFESPA
ncbi:MAG: phosphoribosylglycinamide formyltransferase [Acidobacteria bacterium]|nr:phosphoribosylglycinamide formyltransferase [Acidobacteriota bacterium]